MKLLFLLTFWPIILPFQIIKLCLKPFIRKNPKSNPYYYNVKTSELLDEEYFASLSKECKACFDIMLKAKSIGSTHYIWHTSMDGRVRASHREMEGKLVRWDNPPIIDGIPTHAGMIQGCRCYPEPLIPKESGVSPVKVTPL